MAVGGHAFIIAHHPNSCLLYYNFPWRCGTRRNAVYCSYLDWLTVERALKHMLTATGRSGPFLH